MKVLACLDEPMPVDGVCTNQAWVDLPESPLPALTLAEGTQIGFAIIGFWTLGLTARLIIRSGQQKPY